MAERSKSRTPDDLFDPAQPVDAQQRAMDGLLRAYHADEASQPDRRVASILARIAGEANPRIVADANGVRPTQPTARWLLRRRVLFSLSTAGLAAAACWLIIVLYQPRLSEVEVTAALDVAAAVDVTAAVAPFLSALQTEFPSTYRGGGEQETVEQEAVKQRSQPVHMAEFLREVRPILDRLHALQGSLRRYLSNGWLAIDDDGRLSVTDEAERAGRTQYVADVISQETAYRDQIVEAVIRAHNGAAATTGGKTLTDSDKPQIQRALDRRRLANLADG